MASSVSARARRSPADEAWGLLHKLMLSQRRRFITVAAELDLHPAQAGALLQMEPDAPVPMNELATMLHCYNSNVTGIVDRLEARALVARVPDEHDRRVKRVVLTALGAQARERVRSTMSSAPDAFRRLTPADQRALRDILRRALGEA
ncbi:MAG: MarR family winged helix-turn-helix transcriptional regulator [Solirubrobacteraceae bacterium]